MAQITKQCPECGDDFITKRESAVYCSRGCMGEYGRRVKSARRVNAGQSVTRSGVAIYYAVDGKKRCRDCDVTKLVNQFPKRASSIDGYRPQCKECKKTQYAAWHEANREAVAAQRRQFYIDNHARIQAERKAWNETNRRLLIERSRERYRRDPETFRQRTRQRRQRHPGENYYYAKRWREANPDRARWQAHLRRSRQLNAAHVPYTSDQLVQRWAYYGDLCYICAEPATATDHVKPLACGGPEVLANLRPICHRCNSAKRGDWLGVDLYTELINWVRSNTGPLPDEHRKIARAIRRSHQWLLDAKPHPRTPPTPNA